MSGKGGDMGASLSGPVARVRTGWSYPLKLTVNGQERRVRWLAHPLVLILGAPGVVVMALAVAVMMVLVAVVLVGVLLTVPAFLVGWLFSTPEPKAAGTVAGAEGGGHNPDLTAAGGQEQGE